MDSPERAFDALPTLEGAAQDASLDACASLEDGAPTKGPPNVDKVVGEALLETVVGPSLSAKLAMVSPHRPRGTTRPMLNSPIHPMKWDQPSVDTSVPGLDAF